MSKIAFSQAEVFPNAVIQRPDLKTGLVAGGAPRMWAEVFSDSLPHLRAVLKEGSSVLEIGYGDGLLSCFLATELGCHITGLEVLPEACDAARAAARRYGLESRVDFRLCAPGTQAIDSRRWDAVFAKTVFYSSRSLAEYGEWLDCVSYMLRPGGIFVNYETGRAGRLMKVYRRVRRRPYRGLCLYTSAVERLYDERFDVVWRQHYGGLSQLAASVPGLFQASMWLEERVVARTADNCFIVAIVAKKPEVEVC